MGLNHSSETPYGMEGLFSDGTPKGMRQVLNERGVDTKGMKAADMRKALREMHDFKYKMMKVEHLVSNSGYRAIFIPQIPL